MRSLATPLLVLGFLLFSAPSFAQYSHDDVLATADLLGVAADADGSIMVARTAQQADYLQRKLGLDAPRTNTMVVMTGKTGAQVGAKLASMGAVVETQTGLGLGDTEVVVMQGQSAMRFITILEISYGWRAINMHRSFCVIKGGLKKLFRTIDRALTNTANLVLCVLAVGTDTALHLARFTLAQAGCLVVVTVEGTIVLARFVVGSFCRVLYRAGEFTVAVAEHAIVGAFRFVGGFFRIVHGVLGEVVDFVRGGVRCRCRVVTVAW